MTANAADFAGTRCGSRYEKELETHFRDCLLFYLDGRIRFERYCYGEAACLVFSAWAHGFDADRKLIAHEMDTGFFAKVDNTDPG